MWCTSLWMKHIIETYIRSRIKFLLSKITVSSVCHGEQSWNKSGKRRPTQTSRTRVWQACTPQGWGKDCHRQGSSVNQHWDVLMQVDSWSHSMAPSNWRDRGMFVLEEAAMWTSHDGGGRRREEEGRKEKERESEWEWERERESMLIVLIIMTRWHDCTFTDMDSENSTSMTSSLYVY